MALPKGPSSESEESQGEEDGRHGEKSDSDREDNNGGKQQQQQQRPTRSAYQRRKRLHDIQNPYLRVIVAESRRAAGDAGDGDISDLEDFIVSNPERDYGEFITNHFPMPPESDAGEDGEGSEDEYDDSEEESSSDEE